MCYSAAMLREGKRFVALERILSCTWNTNFFDTCEAFVEVVMRGMHVLIVHGCVFLDAKVTRPYPISGGRYCVAGPEATWILEPGAGGSSLKTQQSAIITNDTLPTRTGSQVFEKKKLLFSVLWLRTGLE